MNDLETIREYFEWRGLNEGLKRDVSPEAFVFHKAIERLVDEAIATIEYHDARDPNGNPIWYPTDLKDALDGFMDASNDLYRQDHDPDAITGLE